MKLCKKCNQVKLDEEFYPNRKRGTLQGRCKACDTKAWHEYAENNRQKVKVQMWANNLRRKYGVSVYDYAWDLYNQGGVCAICKGSRVSDRDLHVDHNHKTGMFRGIICEPCNQGMGFYEDNPELLEAAAKYLKERS